MNKLLYIRTFILNKMRFLTRDVNKSLLLMITFFLILFIVFTVYYQIELRGAVSEKNKYDEKIGAITAQLILDKINKSNNMNEIAQMDKAVLEYKYNGLAADNQKLEAEKEELEQEITLLNSEIEYQKVKIDGPTEQFRLIQEKNQQIRQLKEKINGICFYLKQKNISFNGCG